MEQLRQPTRSSRRLSLLVALTLALPASAQALTVQQCLSDNNDVYLILTTSSGSVGTQVTTVAMGNGPACSLSESSGDGVLSAFAASTGPLLPSRQRTTVMSGFTTNAVSCLANFDPSAANGAGILTLPGGTRTVSVDSGSSTELLVDVTTSDAAVPAASDISASRSINMGQVQCSGNAMAFPVGGVGDTLSSAASGEAQNQSITLDDSSGSRVGNGPAGNQVPAGMGSQQSGPDGFLLRGNCGGVDSSTCQIIVFVARPDGATSFGVAAAGYTADSDGVQQATEAAQQNGQFQAATPTPTYSPVITQPAPSSSPGALVLIVLAVLLLQFARLRGNAEAD